MLKKIVLGLLVTSSLFSQSILGDFFNDILQQVLNVNNIIFIVFYDNKNYIIVNKWQRKIV